MKEFDFDKYPGKYAMHCKTREEAKEFCKVMHEAGRAWSSGTSYIRNKRWDIYRDATAYDFNAGRYCSVEFYQERGYTILEWSDFRKEKEITKSDLKTGMVVECRNGDKYMVLLDTPTSDILVCGDGWVRLQHYEDDLHVVGIEKFDIVAVYSPDEGWQMIYEYWDTQKCIWRRSEVKEVTLSEIAEKFGVAVEDIRIKEE